MTLDSDQTTLHLRCGTDLADRLDAAGLSGDFLEYSDPVCQGPVPADDSELLQSRARFLTNAYGNGTAVEITEALDWLTAREQDLAEAAQRYQRVVLWFEHDTYDQLILCRVLAHFASHERPAALEMVTTDHYPGIPRFIGLGQLQGDALRELWLSKRTVISDDQLALGQRTWHALRQSTPEALASLANAPGTYALPFLSRALTRHLQEFPSTTHGLALTETLTLEQLLSGPRTVGQLFGALMRETEPLPWLGDIMYWHIIRDLLQAGQPAIEVTHKAEGMPWHEQEVSLTDVGRAVLRGERDWQQCAPPERWLGGVVLGPSHADWRWDPVSESLCRGLRD